MCHNHLHAVTIESIVGVALMHKDIVFEPLALHIHCTRCRHIDHALVARHLAAAEVVLALALRLDETLLEQSLENAHCYVASLSVCTTRCGSEVFKRKSLLGHLAKCIHDKSRTILKS